MKSDNLTWDINKIVKLNMGTGKENSDELNLNFYVQRAGQQWDSLQRSKLIHSIIIDYPIPPLLVARRLKNSDGKKEVYTYYAIDGKQRIENIINFVDITQKNSYALDSMTPDAEIDDGEIIEIANKRFNELSPEIQAKIKSFKFNVFVISDYTDEEIEELFYRWNSGTPLSSSQKLKASFGGQLIRFIQDNIMDSPFFLETAKFSKNQRKKEEVYITIAQSLILVKGFYNLSSLNSKEVEKAMVELKDEYANDFSKFEQTLGKKMIDITNYLSEAFNCITDDPFIKKINIPIMYYVAEEAISKNVPPEKYRRFHNDFFSKYVPGEGYAAFCNAGSISKPKVEGRMNYMMDEFNDYIKRHPDKNDSPSPVIESINYIDISAKSSVDKENTNCATPTKEEDFDF